MSLGNEEVANQHLAKLHEFLKPPPPPPPPPAPVQEAAAEAPVVVEGEMLKDGANNTVEQPQQVPVLSQVAGTTSPPQAVEEEAVDESEGAWADDDGIEGL
jgi:hypothetical protein